MELKEIRKLLGISDEGTSGDVSLQFCLDIVEETVLNYCNLDELPDGLKNTCYRMVIDLYRYDGPSDGDVPLKVSSITVGDTSTSFGVMADILKGTILKDYRRQLNRYRRMNNG